jgi:SPP1 gp7 family putative phage head morphogenesis protein
MSAEQQQELLDEAERRAEELRILQERASAIVAAILTASLLAALPSIRRAYRRYLEALRPPTTDPTGATYRPPAGSGQQAAKRLAELQAAAAAFASDRDMAKLERELAAVMKAAAEHGTRYAVSMGTIQGMAIGERVPIPDEIIRARLAGITATVKAQTTGFRGVLSSIVADGASRSKPLKRIEDDLLRAFRGEQSPDGETLARGLMQGLDVHVTTEVSVISDDQAMRAMRASGAEYVRVITAQDEKVCPYCASRHGRIYLADRISIPFHPRCRCGTAAVPAEQVLSDPLIRDDVLDAPFWQEEERRTVLVYAEAKGLDEVEARRRLADHLQRPTQAEKARYPGVERSVPPSYEPPPYDPATTEVVGIGV